MLSHGLAKFERGRKGGNYAESSGVNERQATIQHPQRVQRAVPIEAHARAALTFLKAARPASQSALLKLAETMTRTLAVPLGT